MTEDFKLVICIQDQGDGLSRRNTHLREGSPLEAAVDRQIKHGGHVIWRVGSERDHVGTGSADCEVPVVGV